MLQGMLETAQVHLNGPQSFKLSVGYCLGRTSAWPSLATEDFTAEKRWNIKE